MVEWDKVRKAVKWVPEPTTRETEHAGHNLQSERFVDFWWIFWAFCGFGGFGGIADVYLVITSIGPLKWMT